MTPDEAPKRPVRIRDVAERAGVSVGTVSNVLNQPARVTPRSVELVHRAMEELGFVRNEAARQLRQGDSKVLGMVTLSHSNPFFGDIAHAAEIAAEEFGFTVVTGSSDQNQQREDRFVDLFEVQRVRGLMIAPLAGVSPRLAQMRSRGIPVVLFDHHVDTEHYSSVQMDGVAGGYLAVRHLLESGRRRIVFAGGPLNQVIDRLTGASRAVQEQSGASLVIMETPDLSVAEGRALGRRFAELPATERPDGVFAANDLLAVGLLQELLLSEGLSVPDDVAIVGYDDIDFASTSVVPLTSIRQPREQIAREAVRMLLAEADDPRRYVHERRMLAPELVVRASTRPRS
jgi:LacI family transcriptional regulator